MHVNLLTTTTATSKEADVQCDFIVVVLLSCI